MSEGFEKWWSGNEPLKIITGNDNYDFAKESWNYQQEKLDAKDKEIEELKERLYKLDKLEAFGVYNWEGYDMAMDTEL
jgi:hypothetical protein